MILDGVEVTLEMKRIPFVDMEEGRTYVDRDVWRHVVTFSPDDR